MFIKRVMVSGARCVQSGEHQGVPSNAALMAISAVSKSRISPPQNDVGILPQKARSAAAKFNTDLFLHLHLVDSGQLELDGSSAVMMLVSGVFSARWLSTGLVSPIPLTVTSTCRRVSEWLFELVSESCSNRALVCRDAGFSLSSNRMTIFSPHNVGRVLTRKSELLLLRPGYLQHDAAVLRRRFSLMSSFAMIFTRR